MITPKGAPALPPQSEADFQLQVVEMARWLGWKVFAVRQSAAVSAKSGKVVSHVTSEGWPDLVLVKNGKLLFWELKSNKGKISAAQNEWLIELAGVEMVQAGCVRPRDWTEIEAELKGERLSLV